MSAVTGEPCWCFWGGKNCFLLPGCYAYLHCQNQWAEHTSYEVKAPVPSACFRNICKQMAKMHEAIFDLLPEEQTQMLFLRINASYKLHLKKQLSHLNVINDGGPQNGLVTADVAFYTGNLQALKGLKDLDLNMSEIWEQKR